MRLFCLLLLSLSCASPGISSSGQALVGSAGEVAYSDGADVISDDRLLWSDETGRLSVGAGASPQATLNLAAQASNGLMMSWYDPVYRASWLWSKNGTSMNVPFTAVHFNYGQTTRGMEHQESPFGAGGFPLLKLRGTAWKRLSDGAPAPRTAPELEIRIAPGQTGPVISVYSAPVAPNGVDAGAKAILFQVTPEGAVSIGSTPPASSPPPGLVTLYACPAGLCLLDSTGAVRTIPAE